MGSGLLLQLMDHPNINLKEFGRCERDSGWRAIIPLAGFTAWKAISGIGMGVVTVGSGLAAFFRRI